eukprot:scaffold1421_cov293-Prasinococcus_capsulatus_cf.AAC.13
MAPSISPAPMLPEKKRSIASGKSTAMLPPPRAPHGLRAWRSQTSPAAAQAAAAASPSRGRRAPRGWDHRMLLRPATRAGTATHNHCIMMRRRRRGSAALK